jgi:hypothetical protein
MSDRPAGGATGVRLLAALTAAAWCALVVAAFGVLSLVLDLEVIPQSDAGPLLGPVMVLVAGLVLGLLVLRIVRTAQPAWLTFVAAAAGVFLTLLFSGGILYAFVRAEPVWLLVFPLSEAISPFIVVAALLAGAAAVAARAIAIAERSGHGRPRWPWEGPEDG